ncbi:MAG TPA: PepSY-associated TM helix domain-containing protein [Chitinophaga sp.]|uniref:PepSY-associated TM helix domain-containing protein n=1 Tax=Chitinophaga sp. TaxID=1869181 RepID=UPI002C82AFD0|nr:PepSY-associated TM helix domain-containing protein [Chitinophaga sp.]HVI43751.1 PepSY-associated TM helix domain-containing protein [Chitinophaga sp.]
MDIKTAKRWFNWHKWTSLICTLFLLMLCITGLPLIFHQELDKVLEKQVVAEIPQGAKPLPLDSLAIVASAQYPGNHIRYIFWDNEDKNKVTFDLAPKPDAPPEKSRYATLNVYTGAVLNKPTTDGIMDIILKIHINMFLGIGGKLFLGLMGILFVIAIITGIVLYGRIMKKYDFGIVRKYKSKRLQWLDTHNLLGIVSLAWASVVGLTGIINAMSDVVLFMWQQGQLKEMVAPYAHQQPLQGKLASIDSAMVVAQAAAPHMEPRIITYPGTMFSSKHHYAVFMRGNTALTSRLLTPALVDAQTGRLTDIRRMPWYVNTLFLSEPLHFGDYGGIPLKIIWALFDLATIIILITGLYLWFERRSATRSQWNRLEKIAATHE